LVLQKIKQGKQMKSFKSFILNEEELSDDKHVHRIDNTKISDFSSNMNTYHHKKDWTESALLNKEDTPKKETSGESFSENPGKPEKQSTIKNPVKFMQQNGHNVQFVPDLKDYKRNLEKNKIEHNSEGL